MTCDFVKNYPQAGEVVAKEGGLRVLEVGFGLGLSATAIQKHGKGILNEAQFAAAFAQLHFRPSL